jgi:hypothetical protein
MLCNFAFGWGGTNRELYLGQESGALTCRLGKAARWMPPESDAEPGCPAVIGGDLIGALSNRLDA